MGNMDKGALEGLFDKMLAAYESGLAKTAILDKETERLLAKAAKVIACMDPDNDGIVTTAEVQKFMDISSKSAKCWFKGDTAEGDADAVLLLNQPVKEATKILVKIARSVGNPNGGSDADDPFASPDAWLDGCLEVYGGGAGELQQLLAKAERVVACIKADGEDSISRGALVRFLQIICRGSEEFSSIGDPEADEFPSVLDQDGMKAFAALDGKTPAEATQNMGDLDDESGFAKTMGNMDKGALEGLFDNILAAYESGLAKTAILDKEQEAILAKAAKVVACMMSAGNGGTVTKEGMIRWGRAMGLGDSECGVDIEADGDSFSGLFDKSSQDASSLLCKLLPKEQQGEIMDKWLAAYEAGVAKTDGAAEQSWFLAGVLPSAMPAVGALMMLSAEERGLAKSLFDKALHRERFGWGSKDMPTEIDRRTFSELVFELVAAGDGGSAPSEQELHDIFDTADADASGMVSEDEFLELYAKVKAGQLTLNFGDIGKSLFSGASELLSKSKSAMSDLHGQVKEALAQSP